MVQLYSSVNGIKIINNDNGDECIIDIGEIMVHISSADLKGFTLSEFPIDEALEFFREAVRMLEQRKEEGTHTY